MVTAQIAGRVRISHSVACEVLSSKCPDRADAKAKETLRTAEALFREAKMECWLRRTREVLARLEG